jgi:hypothetical protein
MKVLSTIDAQIFYNAMCVLNETNVEHFSFTTKNGHGEVTVRSNNGGWGVEVLLGNTILYNFENQAEFAQYHGATI